MKLDIVDAGESAGLRYARQTRNATVFIAIIVGILAAVSVIMAIFVGVQVASISNSLTGATNGSCASLGGTDPSC